MFRSREGAKESLEGDRVLNSGPDLYVVVINSPLPALTLLKVEIFSLNKAKTRSFIKTYRHAFRRDPRDAKNKDHLQVKTQSANINWLGSPTIDRVDNVP